MAKVNLLRFFKAFSNSPHHIAAVNMLQDAIDPELLHKNADWIICFEAENESDPQTANYNI
jgi:hypothetical protein